MRDDSRLHLRIVGSFLEEHEIYRRPKLEAVKSIVLRLLGEKHPNAVSLQELKSILCIGDIPLFGEDVLRQALNSLFKDDILERVDKKTRTFRTKSKPAPVENTLTGRLEFAWRKHFDSSPACSFDNFLALTARLFARYGCDAYATLTSRNVSHTRLSEVIAELSLPPESRQDLLESLEQFVLSNDPDDAHLKVQLASTYALLRMNGAGNWNEDELRNYFSEKRFLLDTNILFEIISRSISQVTAALAAIGELGGKLYVGRETLKEFETALRNNAALVIEIVGRGVNLQSLRQHSVINSDWAIALVEDHTQLTPTLVDRRIEALVKQVEGVLECSSVELVSLEQSASDSQRQDLISRIQELATRTRAFQKHEAVAYHDALLVEAVQKQGIADIVLSMDRSLLRLARPGAPVAAMLDDVIAYALLGTAKEEKLAELLNHFLSHDLHPDAPVLGLDDIKTVSRMEIRLLNSPPRVLRRTARQLGELRLERLERGEQVRDDEVARLFVNTLSGYEDDQRTAVLERERADKADKRAADLHARVSGLEADVRDKTLQAEDAANLRKRLSELEHQAARTEARHAALEGQVKSSDAERQRDIEQTRNRRDWTVVLGLLMLVALATAGLGLSGLSGAIILACVVIALWMGVAQSLHPPSLKTIAVVGTIAVTVGGLIESRWPELRAELAFVKGKLLTSTGSTEAP